MEEMERADRMADIGKQHPLEPYIHRAKVVSKGNGNGYENPVVVVDQMNYSAKVPTFYQASPNARWHFVKETEVNNGYDEDCGCPSACGPTVPATLTGEGAAEAPVDFGESSPDWVGHISVEISVGKTVEVFGLIFGDNYSSIQNLYLVAAPDQATLDAFFKDIQEKSMARIKKAASSYIFISNSVGVARPKMGWGDVVLEPEHRETIERNIEAFFKAKAAYHKHKLAYRRGLLMVGPPGNGKSTVIKILASLRRDVAFFMYGFTAEGNDPSRLERIFKTASRCSPSIVVLEDIDRVAKDHVMRAMLNILDGVNSSDGVFVLATSNNAGEIDPALIERPSRFDLVMRFGNPEEKQRADYLNIKLGELSRGSGGHAEQLEALIKDTNGFSMAMLQELFAGALLESVLHGREPEWSDIEVSHKRLKKSLSTAKKETGSAVKPTGFMR